MRLKFFERSENKFVSRIDPRERSERDFRVNPSLLKMETHKVYLLLGTNSGDREEYLENAIREIGMHIGNILLRSSLYESEPWGFRAETNFLNLAVKVETMLIPEEVLHKILRIESGLGRKRTGEGYQSRTLDIDIIFYDQIILNSGKLDIPHPKLQERKFALMPLEEIAPDQIHPVNGRTVKDLMAACTDQGWVIKITDHKS